MIKSQNIDYGKTRLRQTGSNRLIAGQRISFLPTHDQPNIQTQSRSIIGVKIAATGHCLPENVVTNNDLESIGCDSDWIQRRTGICQRHFATKDQDTSDLAAEAGRRCLQSAGVLPEEVDLIIVATVTPDYLAPSTSAIVQGKLGCVDAAAIDINAGCTGFVHALITGSHFVGSGFHKNVLVIGAETLSRRIDPEDSKSYPLFGDGAGAVLLTCQNGCDFSRAEQFSIDAETNFERPAGIVNYVMGSDGSQCKMITMNKSNEAPEHSYIKLEGRAVFKWAATQVPVIIEELIDSTEFYLDDVDLFVLHQANSRIIDAACEKLSAPANKFYKNIDRVGNTSAASIPIALDHAFQEGRINKSSRIVLCGFGAGLNWSACLIQL